MTFYIDDLDEFFDDFNETVTKSGTGSITFQAIVDEAQEFVDIETGQVVQTEPSITAKTSDVADLSRGSTVTIGTVEYTILDKRDDRTGISVMRISKQS